jgi:hypothetical protein
MNWNEVKFRASSWGGLLTEPQSKAARESGELSKTCQKELIKIYNQEVFGRKKDIVTKQMDKGIQAEPESIHLLSMVDGVLYEKNQERLENEWFCGHPDVFIGETIMNCDEIWDIKTSWDLDSFMPKLVEDPDSGYEAQLQCYYSLSGAKRGGIAYCLVSIPENLLMEEKRRLLFNMNVATELNHDYIEAATQLEKNLVFDDIPMHLRVIKQEVPRNDEMIEKMKDKVPVLRNWLQNFHEKHLNHNKKQVDLLK